MNEAFAQLLAYIGQGIEGFNRDPADTDYQHGYYACLNDLANKAIELIGENNA